MYDLVRSNVIHFYHLIEAPGKEASDAGVKGEGRDGLLVIGESTDAATAGIQIPHAQDGPGGGQCDGARRKHENLLDRGRAGGGSAHEELALTGTGIEQPHGRVIRAGEDEMGI